MIQSSSLAKGVGQDESQVNTQNSSSLSNASAEPSTRKRGALDAFVTKHKTQEEATELMRKPLAAVASTKAPPIFIRCSVSVEIEGAMLALKRNAGGSKRGVELVFGVL